MTRTMTCPHAYCISGLCHRLTEADRAAVKALAMRRIADGGDLRGRAYDGATLLVEDGEATVAYDTRSQHFEIVGRGAPADSAAGCRRGGIVR